MLTDTQTQELAARLRVARRARAERELQWALDDLRARNGLLDQQEERARAYELVGLAEARAVFRARQARG